MRACHTKPGRAARIAALVGLVAAGCFEDPELGAPRLGVVGEDRSDAQTLDGGKLGDAQADADAGSSGDADPVGDGGPAGDDGKLVGDTIVVQPDGVVSDLVIQDITLPDGPLPDGSPDEGGLPDVPQPDVPQPDVPQPDVPQPDVPQPDVQPGGCTTSADCPGGHVCVGSPGAKTCKPVPCDGLPPAPEVCNGVDDDCDFLVDEGSCDDGNACTADACLVATKACSHAPLPGACEADGSLCTADACLGGTCVAGGPKPCADTNPCTADACNPATGTCTFQPKGAGSCEDGNGCTQGDTCVGFACLSGAAKLCDDGNACTQDLCKPSTGACVSVALADGMPCSDQTACTAGDGCKSGTCQGKPLGCDDGNPCTADGCSPASGCTHGFQDGTPCQDGLPCTTGETCKGGVCKTAAGVGCNDGNPCTKDACAADGKGCTNTGTTAACDDGSACTTGETCATGVCAGGKAETCQDGNPCTNDTCDVTKGCSHVANGIPCNDGSPCTAGDVCGGGSCVPGKGLDCNDNVACTQDVCDPKTGGCVHTPTATLCDDGLVCTLDVCQTVGGCTHKEIPDCCGGVVCKADEACILYPDTLTPFCAKTCSAGTGCGKGSCCFMTYKVKHCVTPTHAKLCCGTSEYWPTDPNPYGCGVGGKGSCVGYPNKTPPYYPSDIATCNTACTKNSDCPQSCCSNTTLGNKLCVAPEYKTMFCPNW